MNRFIQLHTLTSYPASLLNRDDAGFAKRIPFGGVTRTRISSQCLKRHWRTFEGEGALAELEMPMSVRSRYTFEELVAKPLVEGGVEAELARAVTLALMDGLLGKSAKAKKEAKDREEEAKDAPARKAKSKREAEPERAKEPAPLQTGQITVLGRPEVEYVLGIARKVCAASPKLEQVAGALTQELGKEGWANLKALKGGAGLDAALFGRMVTSDNLARGDAAVHVAHAFTVHAEETESDYFSAVDDLSSTRDDEALGSGHIGSSELTSGLFYGYVVVDVPLLVSNLTGVDRKRWETAERDVAAKVVERLVRLVATVSPGAKLGSTAPHAYAHLVVAEAGNAQPRTLANAFLKPVAERPDVAQNAYVALAQHAAELDRMYATSFERKVSGIGSVEGLCDVLRAGKSVPLPELAGWAAAQVRGA